MILSYHTPLSLNVYGQAQQKSKFWAKNIMFWPKMAIFIGPKIFKSGSADRPHRVDHFEVSYAPLAQGIWAGSSSEQIGPSFCSSISVL